MRLSHLTAGVAGAILFAGTAAAQQTAPAQPAEPSVEGYLCQLAGECGGKAQAQEAPVERDAPQTRGFRIARQEAPEASRAAPDTKGFRLAPSTPQATTPAPARRGFKLATNPTQPAAVERRRPAVVRRAPVAAVAAAAPSPLAGAMTPRRADLMVSFELNSDRLTPAGEARAKIFADAIQRPELIDRRFLIAGHTDSVGGRAPNLELSRKRAQAVADYLKAAGVAANRLEVKGMGFQSPLPGRRITDPANRRVEAELIS